MMEQEQTAEHDSDNEDEVAPTKLEEIFNRASNHVATVLAGKASTADLLYLYARYKQATEGSCNTTRPTGWFDAKGKQKWDAWNSLGDLSKEDAMNEYITMVQQLDPSFTKDDPSAGEGNSAPGRSTSRSGAATGSFGVTVSTLLNHEVHIEDGVKTVFDWSKEGNVVEVEKALPPAVEELPRDADGLTPLHWACDRGYVPLVTALLKRFPKQVNVQETSGQTALHYACSCGHSEVVSILMKNGADPTLKDNDGIDCVRGVTEMLTGSPERSAS